METMPILAIQRHAMDRLRKNWGVMVGGGVIAYVLVAVVSYAVTLIVQTVTAVPILAMAPELAQAMENGNFIVAFTYVTSVLSGVYMLLTLLSVAVTSAGEFLWGGYRRMAVLSWRGGRPKVDFLFDTARQFWRFMGARLWVMLWTSLWSLLFIIPGIIKGLSYSMTPYLVAEYPDLSIREAMRLSIRMTDGHKGEIFLVHLLLAAWGLLSILGFCVVIGAVVYWVLWLLPFTFMLLAGVYDWLQLKARERGILPGEATGPSCFGGAGSAS